MKDILNVVLMTLSGVIIILTLLQSGKRKRTRKSYLSLNFVLWDFVLCDCDRIADCVIKRPLRSFFCFKGGKK